MIGIYKITNKITGKSYIGQSIDIKRRWREHINRIGCLSNQLYIDFQKFGIENFDFSIIEECKREELNDREIYWINYYDTYNNGYNKIIGINQYKLIINNPLPLDCFEIGIEEVRKAACELSPGALKLYFYFAEYLNNSEFLLSPKDVQKKYKMSKSTYNRAKEELIKKKYLIQKEDMLYFYSDKGGN